MEPAPAAFARVRAAVAAAISASLSAASTGNRATPADTVTVRPATAGRASMPVMTRRATIAPAAPGATSTELVAADPPDRVDQPDRLGEDRRDASQDVVARFVATLLVGRPEVIDIEQRQRHLAVLAHLIGERQFRGSPTVRSLASPVSGSVWAIRSNQSRRSDAIDARRTRSDLQSEARAAIDVRVARSASGSSCGAGRVLHSRSIQHDLRAAARRGQRSRTPQRTARRTDAPVASRRASLPDSRPRRRTGCGVLPFCDRRGRIGDPCDAARGEPGSIKVREEDRREGRFERPRRGSHGESSPGHRRSWRRRSRPEVWSEDACGRTVCGRVGLLHGSGASGGHRTPPESVRNYVDPTFTLHHDTPRDEARRRDRPQRGCRGPRQCPARQGVPRHPSQLGRVPQAVQRDDHPRRRRRPTSKR